MISYGRRLFGSRTNNASRIWQNDLTCDRAAGILSRFAIGTVMNFSNLFGSAIISWLVFSWVTPAFADVYVYKDSNGVLTFSNVPNHTGYRRVLREKNGPVSINSLVNGSYDDLILTASGRYNIDAHLIRAVIKAESDFNSNARSHKGAMGLMQLMPDTARLHNVSDAYDPGANVEGGVRHLRMLLDRYQGDVELSLAAYNAGSAAVEKHGGIPPFVETRDYVRRVLRFYDSYRSSGVPVIRQALQ
jgi:soluble lytic murein transglycosylase-like protein